MMLRAALLSALAIAQVACGAMAENAKPIKLRTHSLSVPFLDSDMQSRFFDYGGDAIIRADQYVRLTPDRPSQTGWIFSKLPLTATNWEIEFEFKIHGKGSLYGDGFAMWLTKQRGQPGPVFGSADKFEGLGIFFDTYKNNRPGITFPYVMAMLGDGNTEYDQSHDGKANEVAGCSARGIRNAQIPTKAKLTYFQDENLVLQLQYKSEGEWVQCFDIPDIKIPNIAYLGFSAETGELSDNHDILWLETSNLYNTAPDSAERRQQEFTRKKEQLSQAKGSWGGFLLKVMLFIIVCVGGYVGFTVYRASKKSRF